MVIIIYTVKYSQFHNSLPFAKLRVHGKTAGNFETGCMLNKYFAQCPVHERYPPADEGVRLLAGLQSGTK